MDKKDKNIFEPMSGIVIPTEFTNIYDVIEYGKTRGIRVDDSMSASDKIKMVSVIITSLMFDYKTGQIDVDIWSEGISIIYGYISSIPDNSIEILNAKNEFQLINNIMSMFMLS